MPAVPTLINLNCYILGDEPHGVFSVEIAATKNVCALRDAIKATRPDRFHHVGSNTLILWMVSIPLNGGFSKTSEVPEGSQEPLMPWVEIGAVFQQVEGDHLHILISPPPPPPRILTLNCYVLGDEPSGIFSVEIAAAKDVGVLRDAIKTTRPDRFHHVGSDTLILWMVSIPLNGGFSKTSEVPESSQELSMPWVKIGAVFQQVEGDHLHILISPPPPPPRILTLNCYVLGDEPSSIFSVEIAATKDVGALRGAIKAEKLEAFQPIDPQDLNLWAVSFPTGQALIKSVNDYTFDEEEVLPPLKLLSQAFPPPPAVDRVHIVVQAPFLARHKRYNRDSWTEHPPPSALVPKRFMERELNMPLPLLDPVFAAFIEESRTTVLSREDYAVARRLRYAMCDFYEDDHSRAAALRQELNKYDIFLTVGTISSSSKYTKGLIERNKRPALILGVKDEIGFGDEEPSIQAMLDYDAFCYEYQLWRDASLHPCFILSLAGPYLTIGGCVLSDRPVLEVFSFVLLNFHQSNDEAYDTLARHLSALKTGVNSLVARFSHSPSVGRSAGPPPPLRLSPRTNYHLFPYPTTFTSLLGPDKGRQVYFSYIRDVGNNSLIFTGKAKDKGEILIKFVRRYGEEVHHWCSERGFAPQILGFERLTGGWLMVVMECLDESWVHLFNIDKQSYAELKGPIQSAITLLHEEGHMVHGDIRGTNIMVKKTGGQEFMLVDFDWAGRIGKVNYPKFVNPDPTIGRPAAAEDCAPILPEHDDHMLQHTFSQLYYNSFIF